MQGGHGTSSLLGFFNEHVPYYLSEDGNEAAFRDLTWAKRYWMLYVDQPVGTGYSYTENDAGYTHNQTEVGPDMFEFLQLFFMMFGDLAENDFYIAGELYAASSMASASSARAAAGYVLRVTRDVVAMVRVGNTVESGIKMDRLFFGILAHETFFKNVTGFDYYYNYLTDMKPEGSKAYKAFVQKP
ncbi:hypothetical protein HPB51_016235 [Rhipicephalus microplus]|uniref:Uncharacterized protein n=1 Tax=Rhipicephalus microplus TaxID=6941 RepID=A0A9J6EHQ6_RHIMP|nr:hypothetical protein HPB51_016235 [Rhipicephalus microplus]